MNTPIRDYGRLALLAFLVALVSTRLGLVIHEFAGHAATAAAVGCDVDGYHLFWFGGGYVRYSRAEPFSVAERLFVGLGGLAIELIIGVVCLWWARRLRSGSLAQLGVLGFGVGHLLHSLHYLAGGTFHGYGDPWVLHTQLGGARVYVAVTVAAVLCAVGFVLARYMAGLLRGLLADYGSRTQLVILVGAVVTAGAAHAVLTFGEQALVPNRTYKATFKSVSQRRVDQGVRRYRVMVRRKRGAAPSADEVAVVRRRLQRKHKTFPFMPVMTVAMGLAVLLGVALSRSREVALAGVPPVSTQGGLMLVAGVSLLLVGVLRALA